MAGDDRLEESYPDELSPTSSNSSSSLSNLNFRS